MDEEIADELKKILMIDDSAPTRMMLPRIL
jgi:hypothetical protein